MYCVVGARCNMNIQAVKIAKTMMLMHIGVILKFIWILLSAHLVLPLLFDSSH